MGRDQIVKEKQKARTGNGFGLFLLMAICAVFLFFVGCVSKNGTFAPTSITLKEKGELKELVDKELTFTDYEGVKWIAPKGTLTDGASVPRLALPITDGRWSREFLKASVVHDAYCQKENESICTDQYQKRSWQKVHRMFYNACLAGGTDPWLAKIMFAAVWIGGPRWDDPKREELQKLSGEALTLGFTGVREWINQNDPTIEAIEADLERREPVLIKFVNYESNISDALQAGDTRNVEALLGEEEQFLKKELAKLPRDTMLINFKGRLHKNRSKLYRKLNLENKVNIELINSEKAFKDVIKKDPKDPSALKGLGNISFLRNDLESSKEYLNKAIEIAPKYEEAIRDLNFIKERPRVVPPPQGFEIGQ